MIATKGSSREPFVDILRFLAATSVLLFHTNIVGYLGHFSKFPVTSYFALTGWVGVSVFFIISGYVITLSAKGKTSITFLVSRTTRLFPNIFLVVIVVFLFLVLTKRQDLSIWDLIRNLTLTFDDNSVIIKQMWTLVYEVKFYGAVALLLLINPNLIRNPKYLLALIYLYQSVLLAFTYFVGTSNTSPSASLAHFESRHLGQYGYLFSIGCCLSIFKKEASRLFRLFSALAIGVAFLLLCHLHIYRPIDFLLLLATCAIILIPQNFFTFRRFENISFILGGISYPLYLMHVHFTLYILHNCNFFRIPQELFFILSYLLTILVCYGILRFYEIPIQRALTKAFKNSRWWPPKTQSEHRRRLRQR